MAELNYLWLQGLRVIMSLLLLTLTSCSRPLTTREKGTLAGGGIGAAAGTVLGATVGVPGAGTAIGSALGAAGGALTGDQGTGSSRRGGASSSASVLKPVILFYCGVRPSSSGSSASRKARACSTTE